MQSVLGRGRWRDTPEVKESSCPREGGRLVGLSLSHVPGGPWLDNSGSAQLWHSRLPAHTGPHFLHTSRRLATGCNPPAAESVPADFLCHSIHPVTGCDLPDRQQMFQSSACHRLHFHCTPTSWGYQLQLPMCPILSYVDQFWPGQTGHLFCCPVSCNQSPMSSESQFRERPLPSLSFFNILPPPGAIFGICLWLMLFHHRNSLH